ncbi:MAG TPA: hypothetical protein VEG30_13310 [Terriglobales bacterium]|nr:hypothetical protein [Terriglobales bacterium]
MKAGPLTLLRFLAVGVLFANCSLVAQDSSRTVNDPPSPAASSKQKSNLPVPREFQFLTKQSMFFPDLATSDKPLTSGQKFGLFLRNSTSGAAFVGAALGAGIAQATNSPSGYGQGASGYFKRFGAGLALNSSDQFFGTFIISSALHQDPRFFVMGNGSFGQSLKYALYRVVVTRTDSGGNAVNWRGLVGPLMASGLANSYLPENERTVGRTFSRYGVLLATHAGANLMKEYWPTLFKSLTHRH